MIRLIFLFLFVSFSVQDDDSCFYDNCPEWKSDVINVHLVPHSHDDVGWLKTGDQYFWGANQSIQSAGVQYILDSVIAELQHNPNYRFSYCEANFFWKWWQQQTDYVRHQVKELVSGGQLEFVNGGWVSNDEATAHYADIIEQMSVGLKFLNDTFGECGRPRVAWQIDPFGHSKTQASLYAQMGFDAVFFARIHYKDREIRQNSKSMEMIWEANSDLGQNGTIFAGVFFEHYMPPPGFCFDVLCDDEPIMDDDRFEGYNVDKRADELIKYITEQAQAYRTNHIMLTMGGDFAYMNARMWYKNIDKLIHYINAKKSSKVYLKYSTPSCYLKALHDTQTKWPTKTDDFFPYATDYHSYWTGYFSSRPTFKGMIREMSNVMQICKQLDAIGNLEPSDFGDVDIMKRAVSTVQHHDGVSGTAKQHVTKDYEKILYHGYAECQQVVNDAFDNLLRLQPEVPIPWNTFCPLLNVSICNVTQQAKTFTVTVFNGLSRTQNTFIRIPVPNTNYLVTGPDGAKVDFQAIPVMSNQNLGFYSKAAKFELFIPVRIPPLGFNTYFVEYNNKILKLNSENDAFFQYLADNVENRANLLNNYANSLPGQSDSIAMQNEFIQIEFDQSGLMSKITNLAANLTIEVRQEFLWYEGAIAPNQPSGAYIFRPNGTSARSVAKTVVHVEQIDGDLVKETRQTFSDWITQIVRLYKGKPYIEFEWTVGPLPINATTSAGTEVISRFTTNLNNNGIFYTDANGRQMVKRKRNFAETYPYNNTEPIASNYYPVTTAISMNDGSTQVTILTDRSQGGSSIKDGCLELMVHRRLLLDDNFGVAEALNESGPDGKPLVARGKHWLLVNPVAQAPQMLKTTAQEMYYRPLASFAQITETPEQYRQKLKTTVPGLSNDLPSNINVFTVEQWHASTILLRLEHIFGADDSSELSKPVTLSLKDLFSVFTVVSCEELTLGANRHLELLQRLQWNAESLPWSRIRASTIKSEREDLTITLNPMQIRTFRCNVQGKQKLYDNWL